MNNCPTQSHSPVTIDVSSLAAGLLLETLATWPEAMFPYFTIKAKSQWGDKWESECAELLSENMKQQLRMGGSWDLYRIASVIMIKPAFFFPNYDALADCAKEIYRQVSIQEWACCASIQAQFFHLKYD